MQFGTIIIETLTPLLPYSRRRPARVRGGGAGGPQDSKGAGRKRFQKYLQMGGGVGGGGRGPYGWGGGAKRPPSQLGNSGGAPANNG